MTNHETRYHSDGEEHPTELRPTKARAGRKDVPILYVLLWSTALAVLVLLGIWLGFHTAVH